MRFTACAALVGAALFLISCAGLGTRPEPPNVVLADIRLVDATLFAQQYRLVLQLQNPNDFDLAIEGMAAELLLNDNLFATGVSNQPVTVPSYGVGVIQVEATGTLFGIFRQFSGLETNQTQTFRYQLRGHLSLRGAGRLPFDQTGEISLVPRELQKSL
jgi:LEA14-like dessication related protein